MLDNRQLLKSQMVCFLPWSCRWIIILINLQLHSQAYGSFVRDPGKLGRHDHTASYIDKNEQHQGWFSSIPHQTARSISFPFKLNTEASDSVTAATNKKNPPSPPAKSVGAITRYIAAQAITPNNHPNNGGGGAGPSMLSSTAFAVDRLETNREYQALSTRDRSFARLLVTTTERRLGQIDAVLQHCQSIPPPKTQRRRTNAVDSLITSVLRIGAVQLLFLNTPSHAAVKETVEVLKLSKVVVVPPSKISFVNAVLRRLARDGAELLHNTTDITVNAAPWLVKEWKESWGDIATNRILIAAMEESPRCITVNLNPRCNINENSDQNNSTGAIQSAHAKKKISDVASLFHDAEILPQGSIRIVNPPPGAISTWPQYNEGLWWCQDPSATIPALALYQALSDNGTKSVETQHVIDVCAAPGGKTAQLTNYNFASITAIEISAKRSQRLMDNMQRLRHEWNIVVADGCDYLPPQLVDAVVVDVPCTATGTGSKRPDVLRRDSDLTELLNIQQRLVRHVADHMIRIGGIIVYSTCSLLQQESEDQVTKLLARADSPVILENVPFQKGEIPGFDEAIDSNGWIRVLPGALKGSLGQCDGFFVARLRRIA